MKLTLTIKEKNQHKDNKNPPLYGKGQPLLGKKKDNQY